MQTIITARSVSEPRTYATASARPIAISVDRISHGTSTVSDGPSRVAMMCDTGSLVLQLAPKSPVTHLLDEDPQLHVVRLVDAELAADVLDLLGAGDLAGQDVRRVAADQVEQEEDEQDDPEQGRDHLPQAPDDVRVHAILPPAAWPARGRVRAGCGGCYPPGFVVSISMYCHSECSTGCFL